MAKLNVEVLDMQNGEITKVAHEGAEYAKTNETVKEGDLFQLRKGHYVMGGEVGAFYTTYTYRDGSIAIPTEYDGNATYTQSKGWGVAFRKISADKPTLEQRVETLESDVAALKGEEESPSTFKVGDTIKVVRNTASWGSEEEAGYHVGGQGVVKVGAVGEVTSVSGDFVTAKFAYGDTNGGNNGKRELRFDEIELVQAEETIEFEGATYRKVDREAREGDVVIFSEEIADKTTYVTANKPYKVTLNPKGRTVFNTDGAGTYGVYRNYGYNRTRETVDVYEAKYVPQEGDIVVIVKSEHGSRNGVGDIGKVSDVSPINFAVDVPQKPCTSNARGNKHEAYEVRKATPAEVEKYEQAVKDAEIAEKWAKIGRKPNEFKKGDIAEVVEYNSGHKVGTIVEITHLAGRDGDFRAKALGSTFYYKPQRLKLIAPVESTVA